MKKPRPVESDEPNRIRFLREERRLSRPQLAKLVHTSPGQITKLERGERKLTQQWMSRLAPPLGVTPRELLPGNATPLIDPKNSIPEFDIRGGMGEGEIMAVEAPVSHWSAPRDFFGPQGMLVIVDTKGDSMQPTLVAGDRVVIDRADQNPSQGGIFAIWDGHGLKIKRVETIAHSNPLKIRVLSENPIYPADELTVEESTIVGRVVGLIRRFL